jgi:hypothetical protein
MTVPKHPTCPGATGGRSSCPACALPTAATRTARGRESADVKVYIATSGQYSDFRIQHVFANREDAEEYGGADDVTEYEVQEGPVPRRCWYTILWTPAVPDREGDGLFMANPHERGEARDFTGGDQASHHWTMRQNETVLCVQGWDLDRVHKVYSEQRAQYLARPQA